eukprot:maker-scaffold938_size78735-snap-gene-0.16 protein:Tk04675 transcript:maker-scaffold938_size78735-snap-gene-0.16-mRNA-1 annotation:"---NA---"
MVRPPLAQNGSGNIINGNLGSPVAGYWWGCVSLQSGGCYRPDGIANLAQNQSPRQLLQVGSLGQVV